MKTKHVLLLIFALAAFLCATVAAAFAYQNYSAEEQQEELADCPHEHWENGVCAVCGQPCEHDYSQGYCLICSQPCPHDWKNGRCMLCGLECEHEFSQGYCLICGMSCRHEWFDGECYICGYMCSHAQHDLNGLCTSCGKKQVHHYVKGVCACGAKPVSYDGYLPQELFNACSEPGSVQVVNYSARLFSSPMLTVSKKMSIYLPYGYDESKKYNVLIMVHGAEGDNTDWMDKMFITEDGPVVCMRNLYDNMIQQQIIDPIIIVAPYTDSFVYGAGFLDTGPEQFAQEVRETIMPYIVDHYSTYAENGSFEKISQARQHFALGGNSNGALYAYNAGIISNMEIFSGFICMSGCNNAHGAARALEDSPYSVDCFFAGAGTHDPQMEVSLNGYDYIVDNTDKLTDGVNARYQNIAGGHTWGTWSALFFDAAQLLFQGE